MCLKRVNVTHGKTPPLLKGPIVSRIKRGRGAYKASKMHPAKRRKGERREGKTTNKENRKRISDPREGDHLISEIHIVYERPRPFLDVLA